MRAVVDGDITDDLTIVVSKDFGPVCAATRGRSCLVSSRWSVVRSYDGMPTYIELWWNVSLKCVDRVLCSRFADSSSAHCAYGGTCPLIWPAGSSGSAPYLHAWLSKCAKCPLCSCCTVSLRTLAGAVEGLATPLSKDELTYAELIYHMAR